MGVFKLGTVNSNENVLTTELNSLASAANKLSAAFSNDATGELYPYADFEFYVAAQGSARSAGARIDLYILPTMDGTNYSYGDDSTDASPTTYVGSFLLDAATTARYVYLTGILLPPADFKVLIDNQTGQAFASSGNTLKMRRYYTQT